MSHFKLLTVGNPKIQKGIAFGYLTAVLHLAPGDLSGFQVCPMATQGCLAACLNTAGRGGISKDGMITHDMLVKGTRTNAIQAARVRKTRMYFTDRPAFMALLVREIGLLVAMAGRLGLKPAIRLNGTSDIPWERIATPMGNANIMQSFPDVQFYDYTKRPNRKDLPGHYSLTFSLAEGNDRAAEQALCNGHNVAVVFRKELPRVFVVQNTMAEVINGDEHDLRFLDKRGVVVGLKAKGNAKKDSSGFVR